MSEPEEPLWNYKLNLYLDLGLESISDLFFGLLYHLFIANIQPEAHQGDSDMGNHTLSTDQIYLDLS